LKRVVALLITLLGVSGVGAADQPPGGASSSWIERSAGMFTARPAVKPAPEMRGDRLAGEVALSPGSGVSFVLDGARDPAKTSLDLSFKSGACNDRSLDYVAGDAAFPVSVTLVFGRDELALGWRTRFTDFFSHLWNGFPPTGIRLTYAWGNRTPVGSMYRITDEETVFVIAGIEEVGKRIEMKRSALEDFKAAYGYSPKGPITRILVSLERPSSEKGSADVSFDVKPSP
jgi:hypothetical protein